MLDGMIRFVIFSLLLALVGSSLIIVLFIYSRNKLRLKSAMTLKSMSIDDIATDDLIKRLNACTTKEQIKAVSCNADTQVHPIRPETLHKYLRLTGWSSRVYGAFTRFSKGYLNKYNNTETIKLLIPTDGSMSDYDTRIYDAVITLSQLDNKDFIELYQYLSKGILDDLICSGK